MPRSQDLKYVLSVQDKFSAQLKGFQDQISGMEAQTSKASGAFDGLNSIVGAFATGASAAALLSFLKSSVSAAAEQEEALGKLSQAQKNLGVFSAESLRSQADFASEIQRTTVFADEEVLRIQALLTTFGLFGDKLNQATRSALDFSTAQGVDLQSAALLVGKAFVGSTEALSRYGIVIDDSIPRSQRFQAALDQLNSRFGGSAQEASKTYTGAIRQLKNEFNELQEVIGKRLAPTLGFHVQNLKLFLQDQTKASAATESQSEAAKRLQAELAEVNARIEAAKALAPGQLSDLKRRKDSIEGEIRARREQITIEGALARLEESLGVKPAEKRLQAKFRETEEVRRLEALVTQDKARIFQEDQLRERSAFEMKLRSLQEEQQGRVITSRFLQQVDAEKATFIRLQETQLAQFKAKLRQDEERAEKEKAKRILEANLTSAQATIALAAQVFSKNKDVAIATIALEKSIAIARAIRAAAGAGPIGAVLAGAQTALIVAQFAQQARAIRETGVTFQAPTFAAPAAGTLVTGAGEAIPIGPRAQTAGGGGITQVINVNVGGVAVNLDAERVELENLEPLLRRIADRFQAEAPDAIVLAIRSARLAERNAALAA